MVIVGLLRVYQAVVSPWYGPTCRFYPSCSEYAVIAVGRHGVLKGTGLAAWRLLRCNPWNPGGVDLVPPVGAGRVQTVAAVGAPGPTGPITTCDHQDGVHAVLTIAPSDRRVA
jgi:putative membrane protein insertion efficiency factor